MTTASAAETVAGVLRNITPGSSGRELRADVLEALRRVVPFDGYVWVNTDPVTWVGADPVADVPCLDRLPEAIRLKYLTPLNRWTELAGRVGLLHRDTGGDLSRSLMWRELLIDYDVRDIASVAFEDRFGCWAFLDLWRTGRSAPFTPADALLLRELAAACTGRLRRVQAETFRAVEPDPRGPTGSGVLLLTPQLQVQTQTAETERFLTRLLPPPAAAPPIPAIAYNAAAQLLANESDVDPHRPMVRVHMGGGTWLTLHAARLPGSGAPNIAVTIAESSAADRLEIFAHAHCLTPREAEMLTLLAAGHDTSEMATALVISEHTVLDHLKAIFAKTSANGRTALLAAALGPAA